MLTKGILDEVEAVGRNLAHKVDLLEARGVIDAALEHAATVTVGTDNDTVVTNCIEDELSILGLEMVKALLDDVVSVQILDQSDDLATQSVDDHLNL